MDSGSESPPVSSMAAGRFLLAKSLCVCVCMCVCVCVRACVCVCVYMYVHVCVTDSLIQLCCGFS